MKMKRKNTYLILIMIFLLGCANGNVQSADVDKSKSENDVNQDVESDDEESNDLTNNDNDADYDKYTEKDISLRDKIEVSDSLEFTLLRVELTSLIEPPNKDGFYTYYEAKDDDVILLDVVIDVKNTGTRSRAAEDFLDVRVMYEEKFEYYASSAIEERDGSNFKYSNITSIDPLKNGIMHYIIELPNDVLENPEDINVIIDTEKNEHYHYMYQNQNKDIQ